MTAIRPSLVPVVALGLALALAPATTSYAVQRPHTHDDSVARAAPVPEATPFPTTDLPVGGDPGIAYAFASHPAFGDGDWRLLRPDGTALQLPRLTWSVWAPMRDGAIGMAGTEAGPELQRVDDDGAVHTRMVEHFGLVVSPDHEIVGWLGDRGRPQVVEQGGTRRFAMPRVGSGHHVAAIWGEETCQEQAPEGGGCSVFVNGRRHVWASTSHGLVTRVGSLRRVSDANQEGRVIGLPWRPPSDGRACWGVFRAGGLRVFRSCGYYLGAFSPDGHRVLAERSQRSGWSVRKFAILGHDGHVVHAWTFDPAAHRTLTQLTWEDDHHLLGVLLAHGHWGLVRIGTDGVVERASATVRETDEFTPFSLPLR